MSGLLTLGETNLAGVEGRMDRLESRMDRLEGRMDGIDTRLRSVETNLATLTERVAHLPSKGFIVTATFGIMAVVAAFSVLGEDVRSILGLS